MLRSLTPQNLRIMPASSKILWIRTNSSPIASSEGGDLPRPICYPGSVRVNWKWVAAIALVLSLPRPPVAVAAPGSVTFAQSAGSVEAFDFLEVTVKLNSPFAQNPFTNATLEGDFGKNVDQSRLKVSGFCDSTDGSVFRIRFMPNSPGNYAYSVTYRDGPFEKGHSGAFKALDAHRRGIVSVDPA